MQSFCLKQSWNYKDQHELILKLQKNWVKNIIIQNQGADGDSTHKNTFFLP